DGALTVDRFSFTPEAGFRLSGFVHKTSGGPSQRAVVIVLHGTGGDAEGMLTPYAKPLANAGLMTVSLTSRYHGNSTPPYNQAITQAYIDGKSHPFLYDSVWDLERLIDYLETRPDVDRTRIGVIGLSKGGMEAWLAAAVDSRLAATVPLIAVQSFRYEIEHDAWQARANSIRQGFEGAAQSEGAALDAAFMRKFLDRIAPGLTSNFDGPAMVPRIAPRPLLVVSGEVDPRNPLPSVMATADLTKAAYRAAGKPDNFELVIEPGTAHAVTAEARQKAIDWLVARLGDR
ncbi:MAG: dienelactone hydrolase family protein, partial [Acidobacteriota bacterium]